MVDLLIALLVILLSIPVCQFEILVTAVPINPLLRNHTIP